MINWTRKKWYFPDDWVKSAVSLFHKGKGDKSDPANWRQIAPGSNVVKYQKSFGMMRLCRRKWINSKQHDSDLQKGLHVMFFDFEKASL